MPKEDEIWIDGRSLGKFSQFVQSISPAAAVTLTDQRQPPIDVNPPHVRGGKRAQPRRLVEFFLVRIEAFDNHFAEGLSNASFVTTKMRAQEISPYRFHDGTLAVGLCMTFEWPR